jgi:predicted O-linked N-acetylglucosamine transferase (SPINDLY family)
MIVEKGFMRPSYINTVPLNHLSTQYESHSVPAELKWHQDALEIYSPRMVAYRAVLSSTISSEAKKHHNPPLQVWRWSLHLVQRGRIFAAIHDRTRKMTIGIVAGHLRDHARSQIVCRLRPSSSRHLSRCERNTKLSYQHLLLVLRGTE